MNRELSKRDANEVIKLLDSLQTELACGPLHELTEAALIDMIENALKITAKLATLLKERKGQ